MTTIDSTLEIIPAVAGVQVTVTGTLVDSGGSSWTSASITIQLIPGFGTPITEYTWNGADFVKRQTITTTGNTFSILLPSNDTIQPIDSMWQFVISGNAWTPAVVMNMDLDSSVATTFDISAQFKSIAPPLTSSPPSGGGGTVPQIIQAPDQATAISDSTANPNNFYFWV